MLSHGLVTSVLFLCVGVLYDRHHTRIIKYSDVHFQQSPLRCPGSVESQQRFSSRKIARLRRT
jgi:hypothetical protein